MVKAQRIIVREINTDNIWLCYLCNHGKQEVMHISFQAMDGSRLDSTYTCLECLYKKLSSEEWTLQVGGPTATIVLDLSGGPDVENDATTSRIGEVEVVW